MRIRKTVRSKRPSASVDPQLILLGFFVAIGAVIGYMVQNTVSADSHTELGEYLRQYADYCVNETQEPVSFLRILLVYFRYPVCAFCLGFCTIGMYLLPILCMAQGFFLSFSVCCFTSALGRTGVYLAFAAFGLRVMITLPCLLLLAIQAFNRSKRLQNMTHKKKEKSVVQKGTAGLILPGICAATLLLGAILDMTLLPHLFQWVLTKFV